MSFVITRPKTAATWLLPAATNAGSAFTAARFDAVYVTGAINTIAARLGGHR
jgi:hypothetical protein